MNTKELQDKRDRNLAKAEKAFMDWLEDKSTTNWDAYTEAKEAAQAAQEELDKAE
jgi:hypothetical protein